MSNTTAEYFLISLKLVSVPKVLFDRKHHVLLCLKKKIENLKNNFILFKLI